MKKLEEVTKFDFSWKVEILDYLDELQSNVDSKAHCKGGMLMCNNVISDVLGKVAKRALELEDKELMQQLGLLNLYNNYRWKNFEEIKPILDKNEVFYLINEERGQNEQ